MVGKKKGLYLGLLLSLVGIGSVAQAYTVKIRNSTPFTIKYHIAYLTAFCSDDKGELASGHTARFYTGSCSVSKVFAWVYEKPGALLDPLLAIRQEKKVKAKTYDASWGRAGNTNFIVTGPFGRGEKLSYIVTREVS